MQTIFSRRLTCAGVALLVVPILAACGEAPQAASDDQVVAWINTAAHPLTTTDPAAPLDDLAPLQDIVGQAEVVGLGEATHGTSEIWTIKQRMVKYLVAHMGFTGFALEVDWPIGQQVDEYVLHGTGDPHVILPFPWNSQDRWTARSTSWRYTSVPLRCTARARASARQPR